MDVLSPDLLWVEGRCYRQPFIDAKYSRGDETDRDVNEGENEFMCTEETCDVDVDIEYDIDTTASGKLRMQLLIPETFRSTIIGLKGVTKKRLENDFNVTIFVPKPRRNEEVTITGNSKRDLILARRNIDAIINSFRQKLPFTHFVSICLSNEETEANFAKFKENVLKTCFESRGVDETIFQNPKKLHLTLCILVLMDNNERDGANEAIGGLIKEKIQPLISNHKPFIVEAQGLDIMNDDPSEVDVLYARVSALNNSPLLQEVANMVAKNVNTTEFALNRNSDNVKLHMTVMNSAFRNDITEVMATNDGDGQHKWAKKARVTFDATQILKEYGDFYFGKQDVQEIRLSLRKTASPINGYYLSTGSYKL